MISTAKELREKITYVARIAPAVPTETTYPPVTALTEGPAALFKLQLRNPGPSGKAPLAAKKTAMYLIFGLSTVTNTAYPMMVNKLQKHR